MAGNSEFEHVPSHPGKPFNRYKHNPSGVLNTRTAVIIDVHGSINPKNLKIEKVEPQKTSLRKRG